MRKFSLPRMIGIPALILAGLVATALPASALTIRLGGPSLIHVDDCRSAALMRQVAYDLEFSSRATGPVPVHVAALADGSITLCYSLDVASPTSFNVAVETYLSLDGLLSGSDHSRVCTAIRLTVLPGVKGTVSATTHATVVATGAPPVVWDHTFAEDVVVDTLGEEIVLKACADTSGQVSAS